MSTADMVRLDSGMAGLSLAVCAIPAIVFSFFLRGRLLLSLFGVAVQTEEGQPAGRARCLGRAVARWGLFLLFAPFLLIPSLFFLVLFGLWAPVLGAAIIGLLHPDRGLPDLLAGTYLVPR
jgi:hypothetical protein